MKALDRDVGRVDDVLVDDLPWEIRYLDVDTSHWLPGRRILVPSASVTLISELELAVHVNLTGADVRNAPLHDPTRPVSAKDEVRLLECPSRNSGTQRRRRRRASRPLAGDCVQ